MLRKQLARWLANSKLLSNGRELLERNQSDWNMPVSRVQKLQMGIHLILKDYADGLFPPVFNDQRAAYEGEIKFRDTIAADKAGTSEGELRKPYWFGGTARMYLQALITMLEDFERLGINPPQKLLELGCGSGWMAEAISKLGFDVVGTSIAPDDIQDGNQRIAGIRASGLPCKLEFRVAAMESVHEQVADRTPFDAVWVFEALHHAYSWEETFASAYKCLRPGGWFLISREPNLLHTFVSYRVARLSNTHEIGMSRTKMRKRLKEIGFSRSIVLRNHLHCFHRPHWIAAQR
jgi:SAM-dependent methyltransferase